MDQELLGRIKAFNIDALANKENLASLTFDQSISQLQQLRDLFAKFDTLRYRKFFTKREIERVDSRAREFVTRFIDRLEGFSVEIPNAKQVHDDIQNDVERFWDETFSELRPLMSALRQEVAQSAEAVDVSDLKASLLDKDERYNTLLQQLEDQLHVLSEKDKQIQLQSGTVASNYLAKNFESQAERHEKEAANALLARRVYFGILITLAVGNLGYFLFGDRSIFTTEYGLIKFALVTLLAYGMALANKKYRIELNLAAQNWHRRNVAQTLLDYLRSEPDRTVQSEMLRRAAEAMFRHLNVGFISREDTSDKSPTHEFLAAFVPKAG